MDGDGSDGDDLAWMRTTMDWMETRRLGWRRLGSGSSCGTRRNCRKKFENDILAEYPIKSAAKAKNLPQRAAYPDFMKDSWKTVLNLKA